MVKLLNICGLGCVKEQTHELCLEAVKQNGLALGFVKDIKLKDKR
jgi:hypothetical protein